MTKLNRWPAPTGRSRIVAGSGPSPSTRTSCVVTATAAPGTPTRPNSVSSLTTLTVTSPRHSGGSGTRTEQVDLKFCKQIDICVLYACLLHKFYIYKHLLQWLPNTGGLTQDSAKPNQLSRWQILGRKIKKYHRHWQKKSKVQKLLLSWSYSYSIIVMIIVWILLSEQWVTLVINTADATPPSQQQNN